MPECEGDEEDGEGGEQLAEAGEGGRDNNVGRVIEHTGRNRDHDGVVEEGPAKVDLDAPVDGLAEVDRCGQNAQVVHEQHNVSHIG